MLLHWIEQLLRGCVANVSGDVGHNCVLAVQVLGSRGAVCYSALVKED